MSAALGENRDRPVVIRADAQTPHQFVVRAMEVLGRLGVVGIAIATESVADDG
jgi:biopolymer transport protein ExbD